MFGFIRNMIDTTSVKTQGSTIIISGVDVDAIVRDIQRHWGTGRIDKHMFSFQRARELGFGEFWAIEVLYMIRELIERRFTALPQRVYKRIEQLMLENTWLTSMQEDVVQALDQSALAQFKLSPLADQNKFFEHLQVQTARLNLHGYLLDAAPGTGKAQPLDALFKTATGWVRNGDVKVGDEILAFDGTVTKIAGVFPQGMRQVFALETTDGRVAESCAEHLWAVYHPAWVGERIMALHEIQSLWDAGYRRGLSIPLPVVGDDVAKASAVLSTYTPEQIVGDVRQAVVVTVSGKLQAQELQAQLWACGYIANSYEQLGSWKVRGRRIQDGEQRSVEIRSIKPTREVLTQCIEIEHPSHLYITNDWVVTHNTYMSLALQAMQNADTTIIVAPKIAIDAPWREHMHTVFKTPQKAWYSDQSAALKLGRGVFVIHYEYLGKFLEALEKTDLSRLGHVTVILDESHNLNEAANTSDRTGTFVKMCNMLPQKFVLWMSGTPLKAMGKEIIPMLSTIDPLFDSQAEERFRQIYGKSSNKGNDIVAHRLGLIRFTITKEQVMRDTPAYYEYDVKIPDADQYTLKTLKRTMGDFISERIKFYRTNADQYHKRYFELVELARKRAPRLSQRIDEYLRVTKVLHESYDPRVHKTEPKWCNDFERREILPQLEGAEKHDFRDVRSVYKYMPLKVRGEALGGVLGRARMQCILDMARVDRPMTQRLTPEGKPKPPAPQHTIIDLINGSRSKTVIFTSYVQVVESVTQQLNDAGVGAYAVYADTNKQLPQILDAMREDDNAQVIVATFDSLSTAVPLTMCSTVIMLNAPFRDYERNQAISRSWRLGNPERTEVYDLYLDTGGRDNISTRSKDILEWSRDMVAEIMGIKLPDSVSVESVDLNTVWHHADVMMLDEIAEINGGHEEHRNATTTDSQFGGLSYQQENDIGIVRW